MSISSGKSGLLYYVTSIEMCVLPSVNQFPLDHTETSEAIRSLPNKVFSKLRPENTTSQLSFGRFPQFNQLMLKRIFFVIPKSAPS